MYDSWNHDLQYIQLKNGSISIRENLEGIKSKLQRLATILAEQQAHSTKKVFAEESQIIIELIRANTERKA